MQHHRTKRLLGFVDDRAAASMPPDIASRLIGSVDDLPDYLVHNVVDELIIATPTRSCYDLAQRAVSIAETAGVRVLCLSDLFTLGQEKNLRRRAALFVELVPKDRRRESAETAKRVLDVFAAALGIVLLAPMFLAVGLAIRLSGQSSIFLTQERYGYGRRRFYMYKFHHQAQNAGPATLSRFLERTLLAELPVLWNVLLGDMSLVGPRPMTRDEVSLLAQAQLMRRFSVRPGLTGNWQVAARPALSVEQRVALDSSYIEEWSLAMDLKILARTVPAMLKRSAAI
jgi:lipopolysaccharide/colanic/teichoic acid biosynthesis glycosyltransferase